VPFKMAPCCGAFFLTFLNFFLYFLLFCAGTQKLATTVQMKNLDQKEIVVLYGKTCFCFENWFNSFTSLRRLFFFPMMTFS
jgi:hypothetical protein